MFSSLTDSQKQILCLVARNPDPQAHLDMWRDLKLPGHDGFDIGIRRALAKLQRQADAKLFLEQQRVELEQNRHDAMREADSAAWDKEKARADLARLTLELAMAAGRAEKAKIEAGQRPTGTTAKLIEVCDKAAAQDGGGRSPLDKKDVKLLLKRAGLDGSERPALRLPVTAPPPPRRA